MDLECVDVSSNFVTCFLYIFIIVSDDGSMSSPLREKSLQLLKHDTKVTVMLISLKCGSLG